ncbi:hypothetical protein, partial [Burkholderia pseudomallei]
RVRVRVRVRVRTLTRARWAVHGPVQTRMGGRKRISTRIRVSTPTTIRPAAGGTLAERGVPGMASGIARGVSRRATVSRNRPARAAMRRADGAAEPARDVGRAA